MAKEQAKIGVLLVNLGTPDAPTTPAVRRYLREFLSDGRVIDISALGRFLLVNLIIAPFRSPRSAKEYKKVWTDKGSPIKIYAYAIEKKLQESLGENYVVSMGMRYQNPSLQVAIDKLKGQGLEKIIVIPMFPQYASATTGSVHQKVMDIIKKWQLIPEIAFVNNFFDHPKFIESFATIARKYIEKENYDHFIFSYHGLPERQIIKGDFTGKCLKDARENPEIAGQANCCATLHAGNRNCYRAQCFATSRYLAEALNIPADDYTNCFQSRLGKTPWIQPYTDDIIKKLTQEGKKRILAFSPSFVADCLETTIEVGEEYKELFEEEGGEHWQLVESLNEHPLWVETLEDLVKENSHLQTKISESLEKAK